MAPMILLVWWALLSLWIAPPAVAASPPPAPAPGTVLVLTLAGPINPVAANYIERGIREAEAKNAVAIVLRLDTPGGLDTSMRDIVQDMIASRVPVIVYVAPAGARAASAGMFITVAAHVAAMAPDTAIGAAHPVGGGGEEIKGPMADKVTNDAVAYVKGLAAQRGRNVKWVEEAVRKSVSVPAQEAARLKVVDLVAPTLPALLDQVDGRKVTVGGLPQVLHTRNLPTTDLPMSNLERFMYSLSNPALALILLNLGILGIIFELQNPGAFLPGIVGVILLLLGLFSLGMLPVNGVGVALIFFGFLLFVAELFVPTAGILAVGGVAALVLGTIMLFQSGAAELAPSLPLILSISLSTGILILIAIRYAVKAQRQKAKTGSEELIGQVGVARSALSPTGMVFLEGELWNAESTQPVAEGARVVVERIEGLKLKVRPDAPSSTEGI